MSPSPAPRFRAVVPRSALAAQGVVTVELGRRTVAVFDVDGVLRAVDDMCTHSGAPLSEGAVEGGIVTCPWHGAQFELASGASVGAFECSRVRTYAVRELDGEIEVTTVD